MKYLLAITSLLFLISSTAYSAQLMTRPVICGTFSVIQKEMIKTYGEDQKEIIGISEQGQIVHIKLYGDKTYTIVEMHVSGMACILGAGELITKEDASSLPGSTL